MGLFDTVYISEDACVDFPPPFDIYEPRGFQTKDIDCLLTEFVIQKVKSQLELHYKSRWTDDTEIYKWTGTAELYDYGTSRIFLTIIDGIVTNKKIVPVGIHHAIECSLTEKDEALTNAFEDEKERIARYLADQYGLALSFSDSESMKLYELEGRYCLNPDLEFLFKKMLEKNKWI